MPIVIRYRAMFFNPGIYIWKAEITSGSGKGPKIGVSFQTIQFLYVISLPENFYITDVFRQITVSLLLINSNYKMPTLPGVHRVILT